MYQVLEMEMKIRKQAIAIFNPAHLSYLILITAHGTILLYMYVSVITMYIYTWALNRRTNE